MKIASVANIKAKLSEYLKESEAGPVVVTRNGKAVAMLLAVTDDDELERLLLAHSPKFQAMLNKSRRSIEKTGGLTHEQIWSELEEERRTNGSRSHRATRRKSKSKSNGSSSSN